MQKSVLRRRRKRTVLFYPFGITESESGREKWQEYLTKALPEAMEESEKNRLGFVYISAKNFVISWVLEWN